jgi:hypothetical protein
MAPEPVYEDRQICPGAAGLGEARSRRDLGRRRPEPVWVQPPVTFDPADGPTVVVMIRRMPGSRIHGERTNESRAQGT